MRFWQKSVLTLMMLLTIAIIGGTAAIFIFDWPAQVVRAELPVGKAPSLEEQVVPSPPTLEALQISQVTIFTSTPTPFQPLPLTPTNTPSPTSSNTPTPTNTNTPTITPSPTLTLTPDIPKEAYIQGIWGYPQAFNLSCESRSASDLARYFGVEFTELDFLYALPTSDNPDAGFVGSVNGYLGQLPPIGYGVHAKPVAKLMRSFGLDARAHKGMTVKEIKSEIAAGRPVMVWAIKDMDYSTAVEYTAEDGSTTIVARYEHTFIVIGYNESYITVLDNERVYSVTIDQFKTSWGTLGNLGITVNTGN